MALQSILSLVFQLVWLVVYGIAFLKFYTDYPKIILPPLPLAGHCGLFVWLVCSQAAHWINYWWMLLIYVIAAGLSVMLTFAYCGWLPHRSRASGFVFILSIVTLTTFPIEVGAPVVGIVANIALSALYVYKLRQYYYGPVAIGKALGNIGLFLSITPTEPLRWLWGPLYGLVLMLDAAVFGVLLYERRHKKQGVK